MDREENTRRDGARPDEAGLGETPPREPSSSRPAGGVTRKRWLVVAAALLILMAVALTFWFTRGSSRSAGRPVPEPTDVAVEPPAGGTTPQPGEMVITLSPDELANAHIQTAVATEQTDAAPVGAGGMRTTGTVQANAYREVPVLAIAGGIVRQVNVELGDKVRRGQTLAAVFSTELADAQAEYFRMLAEIEKHHQHYRRTAELVEIGAVSREELEEATAEYKTEQAKLASARQRLILLGMEPKQISDMRGVEEAGALISVESPSSGTVLSRTVNAGEVLMAGKELFRVVNLSTVWVIGQIYESQFQMARVGTPATITTMAYPGRTFSGRVSYIDPRVDPQTRTAQVRIEVANPAEVLRLGMFVDVSFGGAAPTVSGQPAVVVPRAAVQMIGARQVVFVATDQPGVFVQREVSAGAEANGSVPIYSGVRAGERVVTEGSFLLRAESLKLDPAQLSATTPPAATPKQAQQAGSAPQEAARQQEPDAQERGLKIQSAKVTLTDKGYQPASIKLKRDVPARITFVRQVEATCGTEVVIPEYGIKRELPLNEPVVIEFTPTKTGEFTFACGMDMLRGKIVVR